MILHKAFKFRLYPNLEQRQALERHFGCARFVFNTFLQERMDYYAAHQREEKQGLNYYDTANLLTALKRKTEYGWLKEVNSQSLQVALRNLDTAYGNFFAGRAKFLSFKSRRGQQSFGVPKHLTLDEEGGRLSIPRVTSLKIVVHRPVEGRMKNVTISRRPSGWYFASIHRAMEMGDCSPKDMGGESGVDLGLKSFLVTSEEEKVEAPQYLHRAEVKLCRLQKQLSRKRKGSQNREKERVKVARLHEMVGNQRSGFLHRQSRRRVDENQAIYAEDPQVKGMLGNHRLAGSISDASWGEFLRQLEYKAAWYGCGFEQIYTFYPSSKVCHRCGIRKEDLTLADREWDCPECGTHHDRDVIAALNILREGHAQSERKHRAGMARTETPGETRAVKAGLRTRKLPALAVE